MIHIALLSIKVVGNVGADSDEDLVDKIHRRISRSASVLTAKSRRNHRGKIKSVGKLYFGKSPEIDTTVYWLYLHSCYCFWTDSSYVHQGSTKPQVQQSWRLHKEQESSSSSTKCSRSSKTPLLWWRCTTQGKLKTRRGLDLDLIDFTQLQLSTEIAAYRQIWFDKVYPREVTVSPTQSPEQSEYINLRNFC